MHHQLIPLLCVLLIACDNGSTSSGDDTSPLEDTSVSEDTSSPDSQTPQDTTLPPDDTSPLEDTSAPPDTAPPEDTASSGWVVPECLGVSGSAAVTFTRDAGENLAVVGSLSGTVYTFGLVALDAPNTLLAAHGTQLLRSVDAGCTWTEIGALDFPLFILEAAGEDRAYGWVDNYAHLVRIDGTTITPLTSPAENVVGLGVDPNNPDRVRIAASHGGLLESNDAGETWSKVGVQAPRDGSHFVYRVAFDPNDLDHITAGLMREGVRWSRDGGSTWNDAGGLYTDPTRGNNTFRVHISPADPSVVWAEGVDIEESLEPGAKARHIYLSKDGGESFSPIIDQTPEVQLRNGNLMAPHPTDPDVLYFFFGTYFQGYGTDIYRYDARTEALVIHHHTQHNDVGAVAFSPVNPDVFYLGIISESIQ